MKIQNKRFIEHEILAIFEFLKYSELPDEFDFDKQRFPLFGNSIIDQTFENVRGNTCSSPKMFRCIDIIFIDMTLLSKLLLLKQILGSSWL